LFVQSRRLFIDPLSEIFSSIAIERLTFTRFEAREPWGIQSQGGPEAKFILLLSGSALFSLGLKGDAIRLSEGDVLFLLDQSPFSVSDHRGSPLANCTTVEKGRMGSHVKLGGEGPVTRLISSKFTFDSLNSEALFSILPPFLHFHPDKARTRAFQSILDLLEFETRDASESASDFAVSRLFELLLVHVVRAFAAQCSTTQGGWLAALSDPNLGEAMRIIQFRFSERWTVQSLAAHAGMSRSAFAVRFRAIVGQTPLEYLTRWRVQKAANLLRTQNAPVARVALQVGYESESSFHKVFRQIVGQTPHQFRKAYKGNPR